MKNINKTREQLLKEVDFLKAKIIKQEKTGTKLIETNFSEYLLETANVIILTLDKDANIILFNNFAEKITGYKKEEVINKNWFDLFIPKRNGSVIPEVFQDVLKEMPEVSSYENPILCKDGTEKLIDWKNTVLKNENGEISGILSIGTDITERKQAEKEVISAKARLEHLLAKSSTVIYSSAATEPFGATYISENVRDIIGSDPNDFLEDPGFWASRIHPDDADRVFRELPKIFEVGYHNHEYRWKKKDGSYIWIRDEIRLVYDKKGTPIEMVGTWLDITVRKQAEEAIMESELKFKRLYDSNIIGTIFWDTAGNITQANNEFLRIVGYTEEDILSGKVRWKDMTPPEYAPLDEKALKEMAETGVSVPFEKEYISKDGIRVPVIIGAVIFKEQKDLGICFVMDITERKQAEEELKTHRDHLEELVKERTKELEEKNKKLDNAMKVFVGRELTIRDLQNRIIALGGKV